ncbi:MAG: CoA transferase [Alphaproteobacteria bacterium]|nr:CoA transferase [Alphaproteobacteria bacterium]
MQGVRVVDFSRVLAGPWGTQHLADQGATVIKVEPPGGDETRCFAPVVDGVSTYFLSCNRDKQSVVLDLRTDAGRAVARELVATADVLVHNWRPGIAERIGLGWEQLREDHPRLVYVHVSAFGSDDPEWRERAGYDLVLQAMGGAMSFGGLPGSAPMRAGTPIADLVTGLLVTQGALQGLLHRERTGEGQRIEVNMMQAQAACLVYHFSRYTVTNEVETQRGNAHRGLVPYDVFPCSDGHLALACGNDGIWDRLRTALGLPDEPTWRTNAGRVADRAGVDAALVAVLTGWSVDDAERKLSDAGVPCGRVRDVAGVVAHPSVEAATFEHPVLGEVRVAGPVLRTASTRAAHDPPPALGADTARVLTEDLGYGVERLAWLREAGAFGSAG